MYQVQGHTMCAIHVQIVHFTGNKCNKEFGSTSYRPAFRRVDKVKGAIREAGDAEGGSRTV